MATLAALRSIRRHPFATASLSALATTAAYATLIEKETEYREAQYTAAGVGSGNSSIVVPSESNTHINRKRFHVETVDGVTHIERRPTTANSAPPPPTLPRQYDRQQIEEYWSARPVTVARRLADIATELSPLLWAYARDFKLAGLLANDEKEDNHDEILALQHVHAANLCAALTRLGPAFIKMGQQLSIRPDLVPPPVLAELQKLCDSVEPVPDDVAMEVLCQELGCQSQAELSDIFTGLHRVAAASLGQVYKATIRESGDVVAIKVQRPDMVRRLSLDLFLLQGYGRMMDSLCDVFTEQIPYIQTFMDCFAMGSYLELDYEHEAANQLRFKTELEKRRCRVTVPAVFQEFTTRRVITSQWIDGTKLADAPREQIRQLIPVGVELFLTQLLDIGAFHADPHPGNIYVTNDGELCLLDFGLCAEIDEKSRHAMTSAIVNLLSGDFHSLIAKDAKELGFLPEDKDVTELKPILTKILTEGLLESSSNLHERKRKLMDISNELNEVFFRYPFSVPPFFALITRGLGLLEGIALSGDPDFDIFRASLPYAKKRAMEIFGTNILSSRFRKLQRRPTIEG